MVTAIDVGATGASHPLDISIIIPTRNEADNVAAVLERIADGVSDSTVEVVFVDDSDDETPQTVRSGFRDSPFPVRLLHRKPEDRHGGLSGAVLIGLERTRGAWAVVMDGDLQHPPELGPHLAEVGRSHGLDLVIASRYVCSGDAAGLSSATRRSISTVSTALAKTIFPRRLSHPSDPMSGFFAVRRLAVDPGCMEPTGFKILMEILVRHPWLRMAEVPYTMESRRNGESKASVREGLVFARHLIRLRASLLVDQVTRSTPRPLGET